MPGATKARRGRFITFEGGEGTGKSTQIVRLAAKLATADIDVRVTREPGGSPGAEIMRHLVLSGLGRLLGPNAELLLFAAARDDHVTQLIEPALAHGAWVLCDRFIDSTAAYQGHVGEADPALIRALSRVTIAGLTPDLTLVLDVPVEIALQRAVERRGGAEPDRFEAETVDYHRRLREAFRNIASANGDRCILIDADADAETVAARIWAATQDRFVDLRPSAPALQALRA